MGTHNLTFIFRVITHNLGCKTFIFHGFGAAQGELLCKTSDSVIASRSPRSDVKFFWKNYLTPKTTTWLP